jgi:GDP-L-fucose synthase
VNRGAPIYVAGHTGLVGSAIVRRLRADGYENLITRERDDLDLTRQEPTERFFAEVRPELVFLAAARVGGIVANDTFPADFIRENLLIETHVIEAARCYGAAKLFFLGSSCVYPKHAAQPIREDAMLTGRLEPTNEAYAVAKIAGIELCRSYRRQYGFNAICAMPTNLYGPRDNFHPEHSHVLPGLIRRFHEGKTAGAPTVTVWGTGTSRREFLHVDDLADAAVFLMERYDGAGIVNVGCGEDRTIAELAETVRAVTGYRGGIVFDTSKPDGTPRKWLDVSRLFALGWRPRISLEEGLASTYRWYVENVAEKAPGE